MPEKTLGMCLSPGGHIWGQEISLCFEWLSETTAVSTSLFMALYTERSGLQPLLPALLNRCWDLPLTCQLPIQNLPLFKACRVSSKLLSNTTPRIRSNRDTGLKLNSVNNVTLLTETSLLHRSGKAAGNYKIVTVTKNTNTGIRSCVERNKGYIAHVHQQLLYYFYPIWLSLVF